MEACITIEHCRGSILHHVRRLLVGASDAYIEGDIRDQVRATIADNPGWDFSPTLADDCVAYALDCAHADN